MQVKGENAKTKDTRQRMWMVLRDTDFLFYFFFNCQQSV